MHIKISGFLCYTENMKTLVINKHARYDYEILETFEAGLVLTGYEVKAIKTGKASLSGAYVILRDHQAYLINAHISAYQPANMPRDYDPERPRKLLLTLAELKSLIGKTKQKGLTLTPIRMYTKKGRIKLEFALAKGKKKTDKRESIKKREDERKMERALKNF